MTKVFPKSRVCVIDAYPCIETSLKEALTFINKNNITRSSGDGKRIMVAYCLKAIQDTYTNTPSSFPKVVCINKKGTTDKVLFFIENYLQQAVSSMPIPFCGMFDLNSPDLETAAQLCREKTKSFKDYKKYISKLKIRNVA